MEGRRRQEETLFGFHFTPKKYDKFQAKNGFLQINEQTNKGKKREKSRTDGTAAADHTDLQVALQIRQVTQDPRSTNRSTTRGSFMSASVYVIGRRL